MSEHVWKNVTLERLGIFVDMCHGKIFNSVFDNSESVVLSPDAVLEQYCHECGRENEYLWKINSFSEYIMVFGCSKCGFNQHVRGLVKQEAEESFCANG